MLVTPTLPAHCLRTIVDVSCYVPEEAILRTSLWNPSSKPCIDSMRDIVKEYQWWLVS